MSTSRARKSGVINKAAKLSKLQLVIFALVIGLIGGYLTLGSYANPRPRQTRTSSVTLSLKPSSQRVAKGSTFSVDVWEDSLTNPVNAVQANLAYPADKLDFVSIDNTGSPFTVDAQSVGANGTIMIARGVFGNVSGSQLVAHIQFKAKNVNSKATVTFTSGSQLIASTNNVDILQTTSLGRYSIY
jgi:hypothetical protein